MKPRNWMGLWVLLALMGLLAACSQKAAPSAAVPAEEAVTDSRTMTVYRSPT